MCFHFRSEDYLALRFPEIKKRGDACSGRIRKIARAVELA
jgi:hypothetical protein